MQIKLFGGNMVKKGVFRVLLADDDEDDRDIFRRAIIEVDSSVAMTFVEDGEMLMKELSKEAQAPDLIFLDLNMPKKNGKECLVEIVDNESLRKIPVIIYSTSMSKKEAEEPWTKGVSGFVRKPDSFPLLKEIIKKILTINFHQPPTAGKLVFNIE